MSTSPSVIASPTLDKAPQRSIPGSYATGKGTTAKIKTFFGDKISMYSSAEVAAAIGVESRQLSKRLAELVKSGFLKARTDVVGSKTQYFQRVVKDTTLD